MPYLCLCKGEGDGGVTEERTVPMMEISNDIINEPKQTPIATM